MNLAIKDDNTVLSVDSPHKAPITWKAFPCHYVMISVLFVHHFFIWRWGRNGHRQTFAVRWRRHVYINIPKCKSAPIGDSNECVIDISILCLVSRDICDGQVIDRQTLQGLRIVYSSFFSFTLLKISENVYKFIKARNVGGIRFFL